MFNATKHTVVKLHKSATMMEVVQQNNVKHSRTTQGFKEHRTEKQGLGHFLIIRKTFYQGRGSLPYGMGPCPLVFKPALVVFMLLNIYMFIINYFII